MLAGAIVATAVTAHDAMARALFKSLNKADAFTDLQDKRGKGIKNAIQRRLSGEDVDVAKEVQRHNADYFTAQTERWNTLKINSIGTKWKLLKPHQHMEVMMATGAVAAVAMGAIFALASSRDIAQKQEEIERENLEMQGR